MRIRDIIGETSPAGPDTFASRYAAFQRRQQKRVRLRGKLADATAASYRQHRAAADKQAATNDKLRAIQRQLANPKL
jgi:hypothetical protein